MILTKKILIGFLTLYILVVSLVAIISFVTIRHEVHDEILTQYQEYFRIVESDLSVYFESIQADLLTLSENSLIRTKVDDQFTSFLEADEKTFQYHYTEEELKIIKLFNDYRMNHPHVNSVYMGRENGSFVRSHPRTLPTQYDPRERPWYRLALEKSNGVQLTDAYASVTNTDINIGSVIALKDEFGIVYGVLGMDVTIVDITNEIQKMELSYGGRMEFWDIHDIILISPDKEKLYTEANDTDSYIEISTQSNYSLLKNDDYYQITYPTSFIEGRLKAYIPSQNVKKSVINTVKSRVINITLFIALVAIFTFLLVEVIVLKPLRSMKNALISSRADAVPKIMNIQAKGEIEEFINEYNQLIHTIEREKNELEKVKLLTITSLVSLAEIRDYETGLHIIRTQKYVELLAISFNQMNLDKSINENKLTVMVQCAPLHDIGKVAIPDHILLKPGKLTPEEFEIMKMHTVYGKDTIKKGNADVSDGMFIDTVINIVYYHHERWDGNGYPEGLKKEEIPIEARIMAVADVYDALTSKRVYKDAISHDGAVKIMVEGKGTQFDPVMIKAFLAVEKAFKAISEYYSEQ